MSEIKKFKAIGYMVERSRVGGAEYVSLADYDAALAREAALQALSVTSIMLDIVPGLDGMGEEVYARSVADVGVLLTKQCDDIEALQDELAAIKASFSGYDSAEHAAQVADTLGHKLTVSDRRIAELERALKFYADGDHLLLADADAWDTCSGEPVNFLHDDAGTASVEDGSIAKAALKPAAEQTKICPNCKVCMGSPDFPENCLINGVKP